MNSAWHQKGEDINTDAVEIVKTIREHYKFEKYNHINKFKAKQKS